MRADFRAPVGFLGRVLGGWFAIVDVVGQSRGLGFPNCVAKAGQFVRRQEALASLLGVLFDAAGGIESERQNFALACERVQATDNLQHSVRLIGPVAHLGVKLSQIGGRHLFRPAIERMIAGHEKKSRVLSPEERRRVAYHEMGHALVAATLPGVDPVHKVSIIPRGVGALGYTIQRPTEDRFLLARHDLESGISVLMGGRAAEALVFDGEVSTGASDDLQRATEIATEMVTRYGMNERLGPRTYAPPPQPFLTGTTANRVEASETTE